MVALIRGVRDLGQAAADWILAAGLALVVGLEFWLVSEGAEARAAQAAGWVVVPLLLGLRRRFPRSVLLVQIAVIDALAAMFVPRDAMTALVAILIAVFTVSARVATGRALPVLGLAVLGIGYHMSRDPVVRTQFQVVFELFVVFAVAAAGLTVRERQRQLDLVDLRASALEREQQAGVREAIARERERMAREMHDVLAHDVSVMVLHAGAARQALDDGRNVERSTLVAVEETGREALAELRRLVGRLRTDDDALPPPPPSSYDIGSLVERVRAAGLSVGYSVDGPPRELPHDLGLSAYRIVQEALTNVIKHAHADEAHVALAYLPEKLEITVTDKGMPGAPEGSLGGGHGLIGLGERAALFGGTFDSGVQPGGGFRVHAVLPIRQE